MLTTSGDVALRPRFSDEELTADADLRAVSDYGAFQAFAVSVADALEDVLKPR
jgi:hypothetical protein